MPWILHEQFVKSLLPPNIINFDIPTIGYNLEPSIFSEIINFNKFVSELDIPAFLKDNTILHCNCAGLELIDKDHQHILTGNLNIIENNKLRGLLKLIN